MNDYTKGTFGAAACLLVMAGVAAYCILSTFGYL